MTSAKDCIPRAMQLDEYVEWLLAHPRATAYVYKGDRKRMHQLRERLGERRVIIQLDEDDDRW